jgi:hypothetical protein
MSKWHQFSFDNLNLERRWTMKKSIWILGLSLVLLFTWGLDAQAQEVTESVTTSFYSTAKVVSLGEGILFLSYEAFGVGLNDTGEGLFHGDTQRLLGGMTMEKGVYKDERGAGVYNLQNGDKVFFKYTVAGETKPGAIGVGKGTGTLIGGTGKCAGIQGSVEFTRYVLRSAVEGVGQSYSKAIIKYKLP